MTALKLSTRIICFFKRINCFVNLKNFLVAISKKICNKQIGKDFVVEQRWLKKDVPKIALKTRA